MALLDCKVCAQRNIKDIINYKCIEISDVPIVLNTSFNENETIVMKPEEAVNCLIRTDMDGLFLQNYFVQKK